MKKKTLLAVSLCAILVAAPRGGGGPRRLGPEAATGIAFFTSGVRPLVYMGSDPGLDFSDLDVRDSQNNRILNPAAHEKLTELFRENLVNLMVFAPPHAVIATMSWVESISRLFNKAIMYRLSVILDPFQVLILPPSRRFVHNVNNLWVTISVGLFGGCLLLSMLRLPRGVLCIHLRC